MATKNQDKTVKKFKLIALLFAALALFFLVAFLSVFNGDIRSDAAYYRTNGGSSPSCGDGGNNTKCPGKR